MLNLSNRASGDIFRRRLNADLSCQFSEVKKIIDGIDTSAGPDKIVWGAGPNGKYTTKSMYSYLEKDLTGCDYRWIWRARLPTKIQIFLWQLFQDAVLTRDGRQSQVFFLCLQRNLFTSVLSLPSGKDCLAHGWGDVWD